MSPSTYILIALALIGIGIATPRILNHIKKWWAARKTTAPAPAPTAPPAPAPAATPASPAPASPTASTPPTPTPLTQADLDTIVANFQVPIRRLRIMCFALLTLVVVISIFGFVFIGRPARVEMNEFDKLAIAAGFDDEWLAEEDNGCHDLLGEKHGHLQCQLLSTKAGTSPKTDLLNDLAINPLVVEGIEGQIGEFETLQELEEWQSSEIVSLKKKMETLWYITYLNRFDVTTLFTSENGTVTVTDWEEFETTQTNGVWHRCWKNVILGNPNDDHKVDVRCELVVPPDHHPRPDDTSASHAVKECEVLIIP